MGSASRHHHQNTKLQNSFWKNGVISAEMTEAVSWALFIVRPQKQNVHSGVITLIRYTEKVSLHSEVTLRRIWIKPHKIQEAPRRQARNSSRWRNRGEITDFEVLPLISLHWRLHFPLFSTELGLFLQLNAYLQPVGVRVHVWFWFLQCVAAISHSGPTRELKETMGNVNIYWNKM